jgi:hypothetical protein
MKRNAFLGALFAAVFAVSVAAQTPPTPQSDQQSSKNQQVTVVGCLANADVSKGATGTSGTTGQATGTSRNEAQFVLNNARITARGAAGTSGTSGTGTAEATGTAPNDKFLLIGGKQEELKKYLNSEVEIRGTLQPRSDRAAGTATGETKAQSEMANVQRLRVTSVKQTAKTCTGGE